MISNYVFVCVRACKLSSFLYVYIFMYIVRIHANLRRANCNFIIMFIIKIPNQ